MRRAWRAKRRVRLQLVDAPGVPLPSLEGVLVAFRAGHYVLEVPRVLTGEEEAHTLEARWVEVPQARVAFFEVLR